MGLTLNPNYYLYCNYCYNNYCCCCCCCYYYYDYYFCFYYYYTPTLIYDVPPLFVYQQGITRQCPRK